MSVWRKIGSFQKRIMSIAPPGTLPSRSASPIKIGMSPARSTRFASVRSSSNLVFRAGGGTRRGSKAAPSFWRTHRCERSEAWIDPTAHRARNRVLAEEGRAEPLLGRRRIGPEGATDELRRVLHRARARAVRLKLAAETRIAEKLLGVRRSVLARLDLDGDPGEYGSRGEVPSLTEREATVSMKCVRVVSLLHEPPRGARARLGLASSGRRSAGDGRARRVVLELEGDPRGDTGGRFCA